jgi:hypothetical protein
VRARTAASFLPVPALLVGVLLAPPGTAVTRPAAAAPTGSCAAGVQRPFVPKVMRIQHVTKHSRVIAVGRERHSRVPRTPPLTEAGKWQVAWDAQGVRPGAARGTAIFDAHTWPWSAPPAMGNRMLRRLHEGDRITVWGKHQLLCYRITRRVSIDVHQRDPKGFYSKTGKPQIVITVCSGRRLGPGNWARRTYWFASPYVPGPPTVAPPAPPRPSPPPSSGGGLLGGLLGGLFGG